MEAASKHLASVTLELGGKSPTIIDETANIEMALAETGGSEPGGPSYMVMELLEGESLAHRQRQILLNASLMGAWGRVQRQGDVLHLIASRLEDYSHLLGSLANRSRDFR